MSQSEGQLYCNTCKTFHRAMDVCPMTGRLSGGARVVDERAKIRGPFDDQATISQWLKKVARAAPSKWATMAPVTQEAADQIMEKLARALTGDQWEKETWVDIQGYCELVLRDRNIR